MRVVRQGLSEAPPADHAAGPVAASGRILSDKRLKAHRRCPFPGTVSVPIVGYPRIRAASGAGQDEQPLMAFDEDFEVVAASHVVRYLIRPSPRFQKLVQP
jgi:hypothetical protein